MRGGISGSRAHGSAGGGRQGQEAGRGRRRHSATTVRTLRALRIQRGQESGLKLLGLMVSANDPTSSIRARGHGFDSCMLQMCAGAGGGIVGLNGPASCLVAGGHVGRVMFEMA
uniref:Uncharacterized protein n=1 Tax=Ananas comosus var. bracteatus TaxID=296719 RepID=A0A6V7QGS7_ANACO|nr:unnamed protein product [Ananas comosus var. bracteatus]